MLGGLGNITGILKAAKDLQGNLSKLQEQLAARRYEGEAGGGMVRAVVDGRGMLLDLKIEPKAVQDVELLEDLVKAAVAAAFVKSQEGMKNDMATLTGGLNLPGLDAMFGAS